MAPPQGIVSAFGRWTPGIWQLFVGAANGALRPDDVVTSWWRSPSHNADVGGHPESQHLVGLAFDVASPTPDQLAASLRSAGFEAFPSATHVHAQAFPAGTLGDLGVLDALGLRRFGRGGVSF